MMLELKTSLSMLSSGQMLRHVSMGLLLSLLITVSILGNILVCIAILTDKTLRKVSFKLESPQAPVGITFNVKSVLAAFQFVFCVPSSSGFTAFNSGDAICHRQ